MWWCATDSDIKKIQIFLSKSFGLEKMTAARERKRTWRAKTSGRTEYLQKMTDENMTARTSNEVVSLKNFKSRPMVKRAIIAVNRAAPWKGLAPKNRVGI